MIFKNKYVVFGACMLLSAVIAFFIVPTQNKRNAEGEDVVRVVKTIEPNTLITESLLKVEKVVEPPQKIIKNKDDLIGKYSATTLYPEDNLIAEKFTATDNKNAPKLYDIDGEITFAMSVSLKTLASSMSGKIYGGDLVSVYGFNTETKEIISYPILKHLEVLAVTNNKAYDLDYSKTGENSDDLIPATITLKVTEEQAERLIELENTGNIHVVFAGRGEARQALQDGQEDENG